MRAWQPVAGGGRVEPRINTDDADSETLIRVNPRSPARCLAPGAASAARIMRIVDGAKKSPQGIIRQGVVARNWAGGFVASMRAWRVQTRQSLGDAGSKAGAWTRECSRHTPCAVGC